MSELRIKDGVAVVTGAASGIGAGLVRQALKLGMRVVAADVQADKLAALAAGLGDKVLPVTCDVTSPQSLAALAERAWSAFGGVDLLFNNAGIMNTGFIWEIDAQRWQRSLEVNVLGVVNGLRAFVPRLLKDGRRAHIVNTASVGGFLASPLMAPYSATKFAVVGLTESLRGELEMLGADIGVSLLAPGPVHSSIFDRPYGDDPSPAAQQFVATMRGMLDAHGLSPEAFAERVFAGIGQNQFWLIPQPETLDAALKQKCEDILARRNPVLPKF
ncbi:MAG: SDR family NAD(P)-dependent oxidoreductase [Nevskiaceae bacterium]|nr:MAG: SDR family NAD(P)-dependent oxidoreductase [Nevskiaceae bacterium]